MKAPSRATKRNIVAADPAKRTWRRIGVLSVACPSCDQPAGSSCVSLGQNETPAGAPCQVHPTRRRMAIRKDNASRELDPGPSSPIEAVVEQQEPLQVASDIEALRVVSQAVADTDFLVTRKQIAKRFGVSYQGLIRAHCLPAPVAQLEGHGRTLLYDARAVERTVSVNASGHLAYIRRIA